MISKIEGTDFNKGDLLPTIGEDLAISFVQKQVMDSAVEAMYRRLVE